MDSSCNSNSFIFSPDLLNKKKQDELNELHYTTQRNTHSFLPEEAHPELVKA